MSKPAKLSPAMQSLVHALETYGYVDPMRDCGRTANGGRIGTNTIVALINRGILRTASSRTGHVHFPATTPEQAWDEAHAEDARHNVERAETGRERWMQTVDDEGADHHFRGMRTGGLIRVYQMGFRHWGIFFPGRQGSMSASGTWVEARRAADRFERNQAHAEALAEHAQWEIDPAAAVQATPAYRRFDAAVHEGLSYRAALDILHAEALEYVAREQYIAQSGAAHVRKGCPALAVGGCLQCTAPATVRAARGDDSAYTTTADALLQADLRAARADGKALPIVPNTPAEVRTGISDRTECNPAYVERTPATTPAEDQCGCLRNPLGHSRAEHPVKREYSAQLGGYVVQDASGHWHREATTPAEARTGISDRTAAALADVAYLRRAYLAVSPHETEALDRIEDALRHA